jgi:hypothetical protein
MDKLSNTEYCDVFRWYTPLIRRVLVRTIGLLALGYTLTPNYTYIQQYSAIAHLHHLQTTVAHAQEFPIYTSRILATALNTEPTTVSHFKYYTQIRSSNHMSILHRLTSCFLQCSYIIHL